MDKTRIINKIKSVYENIRIANVKPTGVLATRALVIILLVPILLVISQYAMTCVRGYLDEDTGKLIDMGIKIIDHIFIPTVLTALVGFLALWIDKNGDGIPDKLENTQNTPMITTSRKEIKKNYDERYNYERD